MKPAEHLKQNVSDFSQNAKRPTLPNDQMVQASFFGCQPIEIFDKKSKGVRFFGGKWRFRSINLWIQGNRECGYSGYITKL